MIDDETFQRLDSIIKKIERHRDQQAGALEQQMKELKKEFKCKTIEAAKKKLKKLRKKHAEAEQKLGKELKLFVREHKRALKKVKGADIPFLRAVAIELQGTKKSKKGNKKTKKRSRND